jgi:type IV pilus assembly protein PilA
MRWHCREDAGFTLVELMVVVLIIGILVAIAIPVFGAARTNAARRSCQANQRIADGAARTYQAEYGELPAALDLMVDGGYIKRALQCPDGGTYTWDDVDGELSCSITEHRRYDVTAP